MTLCAESAIDELKEEIEDGELIDDECVEEVKIIAVIENQEKKESSLASATEGTQKIDSVPEGQLTDGTSFKQVNVDLMDFMATDDNSVSIKEHEETTGKTQKRAERKRNNYRNYERERSKRYIKRRHIVNNDSPRDCGESRLYEGPKDEKEDDDYETLFVRGASPVTFGEPSNLVNHNSFFDCGFNEGKRGKSPETHSEQDFLSSGRSSNEAPEKESPMHDKKTKKGLIQKPNESRRMRKSRSLHTDRLSMKSKLKKGPAKNKKKYLKDKALCTFYMQGKCQKNDGCPFSHNFCPPRKMELCRYYVMDSCTKNKKCLYLHQEFPCKFFHTGFKCYSGDKCKFSHAPLSSEMNSALLKHLKSSPKTPRKPLLQLGHEGMVHANYASDVKKIPSLFDIHVPTPVGLTAKGRDESTRKSNDSPTKIMEYEFDVKDGTSTPMPQSPSFDVRGLNHLWGSDDPDGLSNSKIGNRIVNKTTEIVSLNNCITKNGNAAMHENDHGNCKINYFQQQAFKIANDKDDMLKSKCSNSNKCVTQKMNQEEDSGLQADDVTSIPLHLPKKQLELFLRIQKQQRERTSCNDQKFDDTRDNSHQKCSSSDEEDNLPSIMKNISKKDLQTTVQQETHSTFTKCGTEASLLPLQMEDIKEIQNDKSVINLLSSIDLKNILNTASAVSSPSVSIKLSKSPIKNVDIRDPRLSRRSSSVDTFLKAASSGQERESSSTVKISTSTTSAIFISNHLPIFSKRDPRKTKDMQENMLNESDITCHSQSESENNLLSCENINISDSYHEASLQSSFPIASTSCIVASEKKENILHSDFENASFGDVDLRQITYDLEASRSVASDGKSSFSVNFGDVDWRKLPFKPVPMHSPATEIDASLYSHRPIHYRVVPIMIPEPDFTSLRQNISGPQVQKDPRLCKILQNQNRRCHKGR